jgi:hypothetical protein
MTFSELTDRRGMWSLLAAARLVFCGHPLRRTGKFTFNAPACADSRTLAPTVGQGADFGRRALQCDPCLFLIRSLGHSLSAPVPSLLTFNIADKRLADLAGLSVPNAALRLVTKSVYRRPDRWVQFPKRLDNRLAGGQRARSVSFIAIQNSPCGLGRGAVFVTGMYELRCL